MTDKKPLISVIVPTYNSQAYIGRTLESVASQTWRDFELIVSDDGSQDATLKEVEDVLSRFPGMTPTVLTNPHCGAGAARNAAIRKARGDWISFLDSDDRWMPHKLEEVVKLFSRRGTDLVCHSEIWELGSQRQLLNYRSMWCSDSDPFLSLYRRNALSTSAVTVRKSLLFQAGLFDESLPAGQDFDLWLRLGQIKGMRFSFIDEPLGYYHTRSGNISSDPGRRLACLKRISGKYDSYLSQVVSFPFIEKLRFFGKTYVVTGRALIQRRALFKGIWYILFGLMHWPFRMDWLIKTGRKHWKRIRKGVLREFT